MQFTKDYMKVQSLQSELQNEIIYHCGPVVIQDKAGNYEVKAAGPTTSIREEPYQWEVMRDYGIVGVIGKGGMGT